MSSKSYHILFSVFLMLFTHTIGITQEDHDHHSSSFLFKENKGQWENFIHYKLDLPDGALFLEKNGLTYHFIDKSFIHNIHDANVKNKIPERFKGHGLKMNFINANPSATIYGSNPSTSYENYFIGNDQNKWASNVRSFNKIDYKRIYNNIDFTIYTKDGNLKYDFIVFPKGKTKDIAFEYQGQDGITLENGIIRIKTSINEVVENRPYAYQIIEGKEVKVPCNYVLKDSKISFDFPNDYNNEYPLVIDPILVFSSYTGSTTDNFGFTATYDDNGFTYAGGIAFGVGYPTVVGSYDISYNNGGNNSLGFPHVDIVISKFNATGSALLYSTYIGGTRSEAPHSLVTNSAGELYIFGTTGSSNFPTTAGCYDNSFAGGTNIYPGGAGMEHSSGTDIYVAKLSSNGSTLLGSTYVGGTSNDGLNTIAGLEHNYGDAFRGEITVDNIGNCYIASTTNSSNFPVTNATTFGGGGSDGVLIKLNSTLTSLTWSTFIGGSSGDAAYGVQLDASNNVFVVGGTQSNSISNMSNGFGGSTDGFIRKYSSSGNILAGRYIGTASYDQAYLVQVDINNDVYAVGQSTGSMPVTAGKYNNPNSGQFIQKFNNALTSIVYSTVIGRSSGNIDISPSAFLVNDCGLIYFCGWGGRTNTPPSSTTSGLPITSNAFQSTTDGSDFYLMVLDRDATGLLYGTFFGGATSHEHVDGGTSRFDKDGNVYQAVCAGCGGRSDFPTTVGAWSRTNRSTNCNLAVFKFNVDVLKAAASTPQAYYCWPNPVTFNNLSTGGNTYKWYFGDGDSSSLFNPTHSYPTSGTYAVTLIVSDSTGCTLPDTATINVGLYSPVQADVTPDTGFCPGGSVQLSATGGATYLWSPATGLNNPNISNPIASPIANTRYRVIVTDTCGVDTAYVNVIIYPLNTSTHGDTLICAGQTVPIEAFGGTTYLWSPSTGLSSPNTSLTQASPALSTTYRVTITTKDGCIATDSVYIEVDNSLPNPRVPNDTSMCNGEVMTFAVSGARSYFWYPNYYINTPTLPNVSVSPPNTTTYFIDFTNACGTVTDSVRINIVKPNAIASPNDTICFNDTFLLWATGGISYSWLPSNNLSNPNSNNTMGLPAPPRRYMVVVTDNFGCKDTAYTEIFHFPRPFVDAGLDQIINFGEQVRLNPTHSAGNFYWTYDPYLSCTSCEHPNVVPPGTSIYYANLLDQYGCLVTDSVTISVDGVIYVPNTFTPNGDGYNDIFRAYAKDLTEFKLYIFNRWGDLIFHTEDPENGWDGTFKNEPCKTDTYVWRVVYSDVDTFHQTTIGHVNLLR